jgi:pentatricopeptide repeat protein
MSQVITALARVGNAEAADKILTEMKRLCSERKNNKMKPDAICYTSVIGACK